MAEHESTQVSDEVEPESVAERHDSTGQHGSHEAREGAPLHPLIDLARDPHPGQPDHVRPDQD
jgi:hypothetical protein